MKTFKDYTESEEVKKLVQEIRELSYIIQDEGYKITVHGPGELHRLMITTIDINIRTQTSDKIVSIYYPGEDFYELIEEYMDRIQELVENTLINGTNPPVIDITLGVMTGYPDFRICVVSDPKWKQTNKFHKNGKPLRFKVILQDLRGSNFPKL